MSDTKQQSAFDIAREAKGLNQGLQEALKSKDPWDRDVDFQRKDLRRRYVRLLLVHPFAKESREAETRLWMQTSYTFIAIYKNRINRVDPNNHRGPRQNSQGGVVEHRKLVSRLRQFLADEEKFWVQLVVRIRRSFALDEVHAALIALELVPPDAEDAPAHNQADAGGRGPNLFPVEEAHTISCTTEQRLNELSIISKALVCLGDIARYREQYNEKGGRPIAGQEIGPPAKRGGKKQKGPFIPRSRDYEKAQQRYEQARVLVPTEGNPSHQLAILASYQRDTFGSLVHYYRALCVQQPFETAAENMEKALSKTLDHWKSSSAARAADPSPTSPRLRIDNLKDAITVLHAYWATGTGEMENGLVDIVTRTFHDLVSERLLPIEIISKIVILAQGALWKNRMLRPSGSKKTAASSAIESQMATHLLSVHRALLEVGAEELGEAPPEDSVTLAQNITATFRRTLPALRMASKWIRTNFKYFTSDGARSLPIEGVPDYWKAYAKFSTALERTFPLKSIKNILDNLKSVKKPLEEDLEVTGFLPLSKMMITSWAVQSTSTGELEGEPHPNDEQLMRLWDLSTDARVIAESQDSPISLRGSCFFVKEQEPLFEASNVVENGDSYMETESVRTDDDPVSDAFKKALDGSETDEDEQDEIVWDPRASASPSGTKFMRPPPRSPREQMSLVSAHTPITSPTASPTSKPSGTTAQDLLNNVMGLSVSTSEPKVTSPLLFGSNALKGSAASIWSPSMGDSQYHGVNNYHQRSRSQYAPPGSPYSPSQLLPASPPSWQSSQILQNNLVGASNSPFNPQPYPMAIGHQRIPSTSIPPVHTSQVPQQRYEPFGLNQPLALHGMQIPGNVSFSDTTVASLGASPGYISAPRGGYTQSSTAYGLPPPTSQQHLWGNVG